MLYRSAAAVAFAVALTFGASAAAYADPAPSYHPSLDDCLSAMSRIKAGPAQCTYLDDQRVWELRVPNG
ncbi:hypothetical protein [Nocardia altamirensis]|uniref:hypothetical protein n=1 Tax=Nocardia altamirensis TaxID=472158 RepID=UPI0008403583|nr:hypothetical protein [Nocardia altamirensis]